MLKNNNLITSGLFMVFESQETPNSIFWLFDLRLYKHWTRILVLNKYSLTYEKTLVHLSRVMDIL